MIRHMFLIFISLLMSIGLSDILKALTTIVIKPIKKQRFFYPTYFILAVVTATIAVGIEGTLNLNLDPGLTMAIQIFRVACFLAIIKGISDLGYDCYVTLKKARDNM